MPSRRRIKSKVPDEHERARLWQVIAQHLNIIEHCSDHDVVECPAGHRDAWVIPKDRAAFLFCIHEDCAAQVAEVNRTLLDALSAEFNTPAYDLCTPGDRKRADDKWLRNQESVARRILLPQFLERESITTDDWLHASPFPLINERVEHHWRLCLELFRPYVDTNASQIWCGRLTSNFWNVPVMQAIMRDRSRMRKLFPHFFFPDHRACAALRALAVRCFAVSLAARALPPFSPPSLPKATAAAFLFASAILD